MLYKDILDINKNFQYSVNIDYDLYNEEKIKEYIPTSDVCDVLKTYIKSILGYEKHHATLLVGPYGKGKSFLILSLLRLVCFKRNEYTDTLLNKIKVVDEELYNYINDIYKKKIKLLPIVIDSNYYNIEQSFLLALNEALDSNGLKNIVPNTVFDVCVELIEKWETKKEISESALKVCLKENGITLKELKKELKTYSKDAYYKFESLYNCLTPGLEFNPMVNTDIVKTYSDINNQIKKYGYKGMFIVYDEFSKTLDQGNSFIGHDLKIIQDFAEKSNRSSTDEQMHLCCITHKAFDLYFKDNRDTTIFDAFKTVSGRFKEIRFNRSLDQNYQIISFTINKKKAKYNKEVQKFIANNKKFYNEISACSFIDKKDSKILFNECYPFNPLSVFTLIKLSELIAQNERTMFTLISDTDPHSFNSFVTNSETGLYNVNYLYDYFSVLFENETNEIKNIWYRCEAALKKVVSKEKKNILKTLAIIEMINDYSKIQPTAEYIALMNYKDNNSTIKAIVELVEDKILKKSLGNNYLDFAQSYAKKIDAAVEKIEQTQRNKINVSEILRTIDEDCFLIPRKYNANYKITRFFKTIYLSETEFYYLNSFDVIYESNHCDGINIRLFDCKSTITKIRNHFSKMEHNENVILSIPTGSTNTIVSQVRRLHALMSYKDSIKEDEVISNQLEIMINEKQKEINYLLKKIYLEKKPSYLSKSNKKELLAIVNDLCENNYNKTPKTNNEMLNKKIVTSAYQKPRNNIINMILNQNVQMDEYSKTSPEMTIYNTFFDKDKLFLDSEKIVGSIKKELLKKYNHKKSFTTIINKYTSIPYGIRRGILPVYIALAISNMDDNIVIYYENAEIEINAINIDKICDEPQKYYALVEEKSLAQDLYLKKMIKMFGGKETNSFYLNIKLASNLLRKWAIGLPMIIKENHKTSNILNLKDSFIDFKDTLLKYNLNSYELLIKDIPSIFGNNYEKTIDAIKKSLSYENKINTYLSGIATKINNLFIKNYKGSIASCYKQWTINNKINFSKVVFEGKGKELFTLLNTIDHNNNNAINQLSTLITGYNVYDWAGNNEDRIYESINEFIKSSKKKNNSTQKHDRKIKSSMGKMFQNNIEAVVEEFADSISNEEKVEILSDIIGKYTGEHK